MALLLPPLAVCLGSVLRKKFISQIGARYISKCSDPRSGMGEVAAEAIPASVTNLGSGVFASCTSLSSIAIPSSITSIPDYAFGGSALTNVLIPDSVTSIGDCSFGGCPLSGLIILGSVTKIGNWAFQYSGLPYIAIPNCVTNFGTNVFNGCALTNITLGTGIRNIPDGSGNDRAFFRVVRSGQ